jgi:DNA-binding MarR family transcriptional regulator
MGGRSNIIKNIFENLYIIRQRIASDMNLPLNEMPLTYSQWQVLNHVAKKKSINIKDLAGLLDITSSAATQIVDGLVNKELLTRKRSIKDRRVLEITLSKKSIMHMKKSMKTIFPIFDVLDDKELKDYCHITSKLAGKESIVEDCK